MKGYVSAQWPYTWPRLSDFPLLSTDVLIKSNVSLALITADSETIPADIWLAITSRIVSKLISFFPVSVSASFHGRLADSPGTVITRKSSTHDCLAAVHHWEFWSTRIFPTARYIMCLETDSWCIGGTNGRNKPRADKALSSKPWRVCRASLVLVYRVDPNQNGPAKPSKATHNMVNPFGARASKNRAKRSSVGKMLGRVYILAESGRIENSSPTALPRSTMLTPPTEFLCPNFQVISNRNGLAIYSSAAVSSNCIAVAGNPLSTYI